MIVAVTGATGYVGRFIVRRLLEAGDDVRAWRRPGSDLTGLPDGIEWIEGDLLSPVAGERLVAGAGALVHAALDHVSGRYRGGEGEDLQRFLLANVGGSLALLAAARRAGLGRAVVLSSRAVFGADRAGPIEDDEPAAPDTHYGAAKAALEAFVRSFANEGWTIAALRPTGVYGLVEPVERSKWYDLVRRLQAGGTVAPRAGTEVHGEGVADAVSRLLAAPSSAVAGRMFNCSDVVVSTRDIAQLVQRFAGCAVRLPDEAPPPRGIMRCDALRALGVAFGGRAKLEATVAALVEAAKLERPGVEAAERT